jgi:hypothetical protein
LIHLGFLPILIQEVKQALTPRARDDITFLSFPSPSSKLFASRETFISLNFANQNFRLQIRFKYKAPHESARLMTISASYAFATIMVTVKIHCSHFFSCPVMEWANFEDQ